VEDVHNALKVVRTSKLSTNAASIYFKVRRRVLRAYLAEYKEDKCKLRRKTVLSVNRRKSYPKELSG